MIWHNMKIKNYSTMKINKSTINRIVDENENSIEFFNMNPNEIWAKIITMACRFQMPICRI
jgi:hypothetical protein